MNAACEIASTYLNNTQSVCDQAAATTTKCKKELKTIQKLSHGPHRWWHFLLSDFIALFSSSGAFRRVVGIYVNKCFNFILHSSQKNLIKSSALHYRMPRLPICFHNLLQINCNNSWCRRRLQICSHLHFMTLDIISFVNLLSKCATGTFLRMSALSWLIIHL